MKTKYEEKYYDYLDGLRESGVTNMWGAGEYLEKAFDLNKNEARNILLDWMKTFPRKEDEDNGR